MLLERSTSVFTLTFAAAHMRRLTYTHQGNSILNLLGNRVDLDPPICASLASIFCVVTKLGWFDLNEFQNTLSDLSTFLQASIEYRLVGMQILGCLVAEMNTPDNSQKSMTRHRKTVSLKLETCFCGPKYITVSLRGLLHVPKFFQHGAAAFDKQGTDTPINKLTMNL
ncbi:Exportin 7 [Irineochytrium annulatum]|nr:Exportin 7 [Irineochytrium annulatum]